MCEQGWKQKREQAQLRCFCRSLPATVHNDCVTCSAMQPEAEVPEPRPAHLLGAVKAVPDTCSAYRPYGQTCETQDTPHSLYLDQFSRACVLGLRQRGGSLTRSEIHAVKRRSTESLTCGLFCPAGSAPGSASEENSLPAQLAHRHCHTCIPLIL